MSEHKVLFSREAEEYKMMGWIKVARDLVAALFKGRSGMPILVLVAVDDAAQWLCGNKVCVLLASTDYPHNVKDYIVNNRLCCNSEIKVPPEFIQALNNIFGIDLNPNLCEAHIETPLTYVDDISLLIQVERVVSDPEHGFGLVRYELK